MFQHHRYLFHRWLVYQFGWWMVKVKDPRIPSGKMCIEGCPDWPWDSQMASLIQLTTLTSQPPTVCDYFARSLEQHAVTSAQVLHFGAQCLAAWTVHTHSMKSSFAMDLGLILCWYVFCSSQISRGTNVWTVASAKGIGPSAAVLKKIRTWRSMTCIRGRIECTVSRRSCCWMNIIYCFDETIWNNSATIWYNREHDRYHMFPACLHPFTGGCSVIHLTCRMLWCWSISRRCSWCNRVFSMINLAQQRIWYICFISFDHFFGVLCFTWCFAPMRTSGKTSATHLPGATAKEASRLTFVGRYATSYAS